MPDSSCQFGSHLSWAASLAPPSRTVLVLSACVSLPVSLSGVAESVGVSIVEPKQAPYGRPEARLDQQRHASGSAGQTGRGPAGRAEGISALPKVKSASLFALTFHSFPNPACMVKLKEQRRYGMAAAEVGVVAILSRR